MCGFLNLLLLNMFGFLCRMFGFLQGNFALSKMLQALGKSVFAEQAFFKEVDLHLKKRCFS